MRTYSERTYNKEKVIYPVIVHVPFSKEKKISKHKALWNKFLKSIMFN